MPNLYQPPLFPEDQKMPSKPNNKTKHNVIIELTLLLAPAKESLTNKTLDQIREWIVIRNPTAGKHIADYTLRLLCKEVGIRLKGQQVPKPASPTNKLEARVQALEKSHDTMLDFLDRLAVQTLNTSGIANRAFDALEALEAKEAATVALVERLATQLRNTSDVANRALNAVLGVQNTKEG